LLLVQKTACETAAYAHFIIALSYIFTDSGPTPP